MRIKKLNPYLVAIIIATIGLGVYLILKKTERSEDFLNEVETSIPTTRPGAATRVETPPGQPLVPALKLDPKTKKPIEVFPENDFSKKQETLTTVFKNSVKLDIDLPANMIFTELDIEDGVGAIYGKDQGTGDEFAILATKRPASVETISAFLSDNKTALPMLKGKNFQVSGDLQRLSAPKETGIGSVTIIPGNQSGGKGIMALHAQRLDGKGSYLFLMEADQGTFDQNEEGLVKMLKTIRTKP